KQLTDCADRLNFCAMCLNVNAPAIQGEYLARWGRNPDDPDDFGYWRAQLPLIVSGQTVGRLEIVGRREDGVISSKIAALASLLEDLEPDAQANSGNPSETITFSASDTNADLQAPPG